jgi:hypothetical protein
MEPIDNEENENFKKLVKSIVSDEEFVEEYDFKDNISMDPNSLANLFYRDIL